jgi:Fe2+ transport system protein FeoA
MAAAADRPLSTCVAGQNFRLARVVDQSPEFLRNLSQAGLEIGAQFHLVANDAGQERVTIRIADQNKSLAREAASKLMVR